MMTLSIKTKKVNEYRMMEDIYMKKILNIITWIFVPYVKVALILYKKWEGKYSKVIRMLGSIAAGFLGCILYFAILGTIPQDESPQTIPQQQTPQQAAPKPTISPEEQAKMDYKEWIDNQFSAWDGSHMDLVNLVKGNMNDPKSFEHVETKYVDNGDNLTIFMKFRGTNAFGGKILNTVTGIADYKTSTIKIVEYNGEPVK